MTEDSDTDSCELVVRPSTLRWNPSAPDDPMDSHDERLARVRDAMTPTPSVGCRDFLHQGVREGGSTPQDGGWHPQVNQAPTVVCTERAIDVVCGRRNRGCAVLECLIAKAQQAPSLHDGIGRLFTQPGHHVQGRSLGVDPQPRISTSSLGCPLQRESRSEF